jgi:hypothetical protein
MKTFREYLQEAELMESNPAVGDVFELEIAREEIVLESYVVDVVEDGIVIEADDTMMRILMHVGYLTENSNMFTAQDTTSPINGKKDARRYNFEKSPDNDLEEQQGMSQQAQDAFKELDAISTGSKPAGATGLDNQAADFERRSRDGQTGKSTKLKDRNPIDQYEWKKSTGQFQGSYQDYVNSLKEAKYQGREVPLGKKMAGDVKKSKVYVRGPKGNVVKVNFGDPNMTIKKSNPARRKSFRARHNCANPGPRWKARYWSCRSW